MVKIFELLSFLVSKSIQLLSRYGDFVSDEDLALAPKKKVIYPFVFSYVGTYNKEHAHKRAHTVQQIGRRARPSNSASGPRTNRSGASFSIEAEADNFGDESVVGEEVVHRVDCHNPV